MRDVAKTAGCSINTVSRALNGKSEVSSETKTRILEVAARLRYKPDRLARGLRSSKTGTIGVIVGDIGNPYFSMVVKGIVKTARAHDYNIVLQGTDEDYDREREAIQVILSERVDGVIIAPTQKGTETIVELGKSEVPFVLVSRYFTDLGTDYVIMDDLQGGFLAAEHLIKQGHRHIAMVNGPLHISSARERFEGYKKALSERGIEFDASRVVSGALTIETGYRLAARLLKRSAPSAIFAFSDFVAFGVLRAIRERGLRVPEDVAVVGFDDILFASCLETPLTTVSGSRRKLGSRAAELLIRKLAKEGPTKPTRIRLPVQLAVRATA
jgi:LacI family transcriptional regulator